MTRHYIDASKGYLDMTRYYVEYINEDKIQDVVYLYAPSQIFVQSIMSDYKIIAKDQTD